MSKRTLLSLPTLLIILAFSLNAFGQSAGIGAIKRASILRMTGSVSEREQDGLNGPVRRVRTETAKITNKNGKTVEGQRVTLEVAAYDIKGAKIENAYYPVSGAAVTGKEVYKYDDKGNIVEMTLQDEKGTLLSKETYTYEFDQFGNWIKMTTAVAIIENGKLTFEPTEVTYRTISYYLDEATLAKMSQPAAAPAAAATPANNPAPSSGTANNASTNSAVNTPSNSSTLGSTQPAQTQAVSKPATSEASKQPATQTPLQPASSSQAPIVKTSAPVSDKQVAASSEQKNVSTGTKPAEARPAETKAVEEQAAKPVIKPLLKPVSGGVLNGKAMNLPKPSYPAAARSAKMSGVVVVEVVIDVNGKVISARALSGPVLLQQAAVQAAYQAKFSPTTLAGQPVKVVGTINYNFLVGQ